jgi:hypothetical protein
MVLVALTVTLAVAVTLQLSASQDVSAQGTSGPHSPLYVANPPMLS